MSGKLLVDFLELLVTHGLGLGNDLLLLGLVVLLGLGLSLLLEGGDKGSLGPSSCGGEVTENAEFSMSLKSDKLEGLWDDHSLLLVIWEWDSLENLELLESSLSLWSLMWGHSSDSSPEDSGWGFEVFKVSSWVSVVRFSDIFSPLELVSEQRSGDVHLLTSHNDDSLSSHDLLGDLGCKSANQVTSSVYDNLLFEHT